MTEYSWLHERADLIREGERKYEGEKISYILEVSLEFQKVYKENEKRN